MPLTSAALGVMIGASAVGNVAKQVGNLIDVKNAPDQLKSVGSIDLAKITNADKSFIERYQIEDFDKVAETYERTGYRVDIDCDADTLKPFNEFIEDRGIYSIRYYFNPLQIDSVMMDSKINIPKSMMDDFRLRLGNGIRLWNVRHSDVTMGDFAYDNVEEAYI